mmetsp:Transcript_37719/g.82871  ORF Transcript_37719/g.82871 Transcript_37719/m.82871 type:complete len:243 (-) Transcript_37719:78-806(-)
MPLEAVDRSPEPLDFCLEFLVLPRLRLSSLSSRKVVQHPLDSLQFLVCAGGQLVVVEGRVLQLFPEPPNLQLHLWDFVAGIGGDVEVVSTAFKMPALVVTEFCRGGSEGTQSALRLPKSLRMRTLRIHLGLLQRLPGLLKGLARVFLDLERVCSQLASHLRRSLCVFSSLSSIVSVGGRPFLHVGRHLLALSPLPVRLPEGTSIGLLPAHLGGARQAQRAARRQEERGEDAQGGPCAQERHG